MTVNAKLPRNVEQAYMSAAQRKGVSVESLVAEVLVSNAPLADSSPLPELIEEHSIPVLRTGPPVKVPEQGVS